MKNFVIFVFLASILIVGVVYIAPLSSHNHYSKINATKALIFELQNRLEDFKQDCGFYPTEEQGWQALYEEPTIEPTCAQYSPYLEKKSYNFTCANLLPEEIYKKYEEAGLLSTGNVIMNFLKDCVEELIEPEAFPRDSWGNKLIYRPSKDGKSYTIISYGSDSKRGGIGLAKDIKNTDL